MTRPSSSIRVGTAGWSVPKASAGRFQSAGTHLERYAQQLPCVEINSCFYRPHAAATYARWRDCTPPHFRFAVKLPKAITHGQRLVGVHDQVIAFLEQTNGLGPKRGPILVQLPPSLAFDGAIARAFFDDLRDLYEGPLVCEPRHPTWFDSEVSVLLERCRVARVAADPPPVPGANGPAGWPGLAYFRWHGSPRTYWSRYTEADLDAFESTLRSLGALDVWCVFDNTASGAAIDNALDIHRRLAL